MLASFTERAAAEERLKAIASGSDLSSQDCFFQMMDCYWKMGQYQDARLVGEYVFEHMTEDCFSDVPDILSGYCQLLREIDASAESLAFLSGIQKRFPELAWVSDGSLDIEKLYSFETSGAFKKAAQHCLRLETTYPESPFVTQGKALLFRANQLRLMKEYPEAALLYQGVLTTYPDLPACRSQLVADYITQCLSPTKKERSPERRVKR